MVKIETVSIIYQYPKILLGMKKVRFGKGKYNGFGGGVRDNESLLESAIRETSEETGGVIMVDPRRMGNILFHFQSNEDDHDVHFFRATKTRGTPRETEEMRPEWFDINQIPYGQMWVDDIYWLPLLLAGKSFRGEFEFDLEGGIASHQLDEIARLE
jgi:8-oxo-dGTP pyrophosphatase MutT (NUDIX family)